MAEAADVSSAITAADRLEDEEEDDDDDDDDELEFELDDEEAAVDKFVSDTRLLLLLLEAELAGEGDGLRYS